MPTKLNGQLLVLSESLNQTLRHLADITSNLNHQMQTSDKILSQISSVIVNSDDLVRGLKKHWLLRGLFKTTNAPH